MASRDLPGVRQHVRRVQCRAAHRLHGLPDDGPSSHSFQVLCLEQTTM
jgi:hypothetical protein